MQNGASTIDLDDPLDTQTCDLWYTRDIYETFDLLITFIPYFLIIISSLGLIGIYFHRKCFSGGYGRQQRRFAISGNQRRLLFSIHLFLIWFLVTWSPWVLYDFFQTILNLTYSVYIDAITTFIVYLNYTFSSTIVLITFRKFRKYCLHKIGMSQPTITFQKRVAPAKTVQYVPAENHDMNYDNKFRFLHRSIILCYLLIINFIINGINADTKKSLNDIGNEKHVFDGQFSNKKNFVIDDCIPLAFGDFNADKIIDIFCRNTQGNSIRVMLNDDRSPTSKVQYIVNITGIIYDALAADYDGDSKLDLFILYKTTSDQTMYNGGFLWGDRIKL
ncbi:unnamed protein product, partial [Rotaria sp. Silwood1]